ncbi:glycoside hydrolase family 32 protein [Flavihumibacter sp. CACIAM 22H1]|uniref:glycoside hydrolase family 32 protein n=1 Tax=Flavihumibacter sp. CACIAM 22H1 TaxID=1812911 RepID=UPI000B12AC38|nr:glycoside hydrolase family 32 protein [Flavihumibacter sp. CACIAM 22H1]
MIKHCMIAWVACLLAGRAIAQEAFDRYFVAEKKYLQLPVKNGAPKRTIEIWKDGVKLRFFEMELAEQEADWYAYLDISQWKGKKIELRVDQLSKNARSFRPILQRDEDANEPKPYTETLRGQLHFSPKRGWTNDPNGLVYYQGQYHLFFQHNPYGRGWGNMTWGHAVSKDLLHWTELGDVLHPDGYGPMFSGSAVVDSANSSGLGENGNAPLVMFFTGATCWCQGLAWTNDGLNFHKLNYAPVPRVNKDNRDPKVFWYAPGKHWVMLFWVPLDDGTHTQRFFSSTNLKDWTPTGQVKGGKGDDRYLFECPDFFELPVDGNAANKKWVLSAANTQYAIGSFDGSVFKPEQERLQGMWGRDYYAAQTINNEPSGRRIEIGWWRTHTDKDNMGFNQSMSLPMELKLVSTPEGIRMVRLPVKELESLRAEQVLNGAKRVGEKTANPLAGISADLLELQAVVEPGKVNEVRFNLNGLEFVYNVQAQEMSADGVTAKLPLVKGRLQLSFYIDRTGVELFANQGFVYMPINKNLNGRNCSINVVGGTAKFHQLNLYRLSSVWQ